MLIGLIFSIVAGALVGLQNIFNSKVNEHASSWMTTTLVLGLGFAASLLLGIVFEGGAMFTLNLSSMETWYWFSGIIGVGVVTCVVQGVRRLGPTFAISVVLITQLITAMIWDTMGWLGLEKVPFSWNKLIGVLILIGGILVFKLGGRQEGIVEKVRGGREHVRD